MKAILLVLTLILSIPAFALENPFPLPELHKIKTFIIDHSLNCTPEDNGIGFQITPTSKFTHYSNAFIACSSIDGSKLLEIYPSPYGDNFGLVADLGDTPIESVTAAKAFYLENRAGKENIFRRASEIKENHTYAIIEATGEYRALWIMRVLRLPNVNAGDKHPIIIQFVVKSFYLFQNIDQALDFDWNRENKRH